MLGEIQLRRGRDGAPLKIASSFSDMTVLGEGPLPGGAVPAAPSAERAAAMELTIDSSGRILHASPAVKAVLGYKANDVVGKHVLEFIPLDYHIVVSRMLMRMLECCKDTLFFWTAVKHRDGTLRYFVNECRGLFDDRGERTIAATCHDITGRLDRIKSAAGRIGHEIPLSVFRTGDGRPGTATDPFETLTAREREVYYLAAEGYSSTQIGTLLTISPRTVEAHRSSLMKKLRVHSMPQLIRYALCRTAFR
jgi:PAS domain S-box-containing protein